MGRSPGWGAEQTGRAPMRSPGRPGVNQRDAKRAFWERVTEGLSSEGAALACDVSQPVGRGGSARRVGWHRPTWRRTQGRYLSFAEREELALLRAQGYGVREIAPCLGRSPSTVSRELLRNAATRSGMLAYRPRSRSG